MDRVAAMQEYIDKVVQFEYVKSIGGDSNDDDDDYELEGDAAIDVVGMGNKPSTLVLDDDVFYDAGDDDTMFPLHAAAREGRLEEVESILSMKSDADNTLPNSIDSSGQTPLHLAADQGHVDVVKTLILNGADIHIVDNDGISILQAAVIGGNVDCCRILLSLGADPHQRDEDGDTPFDSAKDDEDLKVLFEEHEKSPLKLNDTELIRKLGEQWNEAPVDVKEELKKLEQSIVLDLDDDGDI
jgi:ankyrin repeat protein